ncbi:class Ib ribonucleoside-diphosphate reductase assembly flavoprotein NrdI [Macrococcus armenti]|uniref:class Ib ribonucleoside-diphosphate reductase assembly flavoprotein NrdI n=1 Tax=Macrococcus armenti TaxID=2875764 RepID=UPI001CC9495B|nr:class Ib ribonucleoside-diphosphate reductase assembly flavoprotein NrdI [Macrococcus armenti]UBH21912.1 class Ib ribonucleoside-diphosphate reductase assembly flavoprotein NrdI [Macrococcus armenti]
MTKNKPIIAYYSMTGNVRRFVEDYLDGYETIDITEVDNVDSPYVLITPTYYFGQVPEEVNDFLVVNSETMVGVIASGQMNWGVNYGKAGDIISDHYGVPLIAKFELRGTKYDGERIKRKLNKMETQ